MVFQNRFDYVSSGHHAPVVPHFPRSARMKRSVRKKVENQRTYAIDLLANIASKLLMGGENILIPGYNSGTYAPVAAGNDDFLKFEPVDQLSCNEEAYPRENASLSHMTDGLNHLKATKTMSLGSASIFEKSDVSDEDATGEESKLVFGKDKIGNDVNNAAEKCCEGFHSSIVETHKPKKLANQKLIQGENEMASDGSMNLDTSSPDLFVSNNNVEVTLYRKNILHNGSSGNKKDANGCNLDKYDDDNSSGCTQSIATSVASMLHRISDHGHGRIRKILASKFSKVATKILREDETANCEKNSSCRKRVCCTRQRAPTSSLKRRTWFEHYSTSTCDGRNYEEVSNSCKKNWIKSELNDSHDSSQEANNICSSRIETKSGYNSPEYHVKLSIKSFEIPELVLEIPQTVTVGFLKRIILDSVTAILGDGLHIGVLLQGKKVTDDNKTLHQAGISHGDELDNLRFLLEPNTRQTPEKLTSVKDPHLLNLGCAPDPLERIPTAAPFVKDQWGSYATHQTVKICPGSDQDSVHSQPDVSSLQNLTVNSLALVTVPQVNVEAVAMIAPHSKPKSKRSEVAQRRVRRPFSVAEVEALVQAVEKHGTGRWRDVKLCAFENAMHRTYVDLKDKWKTLVHTARIPPQQRRGEPVPHELLDRVLSAHAYWSQQQSKLQVKSLPPAGNLLLLP